MNNHTVIRAENISKLYRLGEVGTGTISHDINRAWKKILGKEDPYLKIGQINDRNTNSTNDYVWSLQNINFEINQGDTVGIIGRNGAGKSTLLKVLSKVTKPTTGSFKLKGRIASLLEVGTGFHPEMTGRENIFLNGAILGMTKNEIKRKFDEIVDFAGVERYVDTPVKRYSSGMYVRLAFAVAANLESEILIVDEVLAVGDSEFQKKCLGKMSDISKGEGRTVLFVSHNISAVKNLCTKGLYLKNGENCGFGEIDTIINSYIRGGAEDLNISYKANKISKDTKAQIIEVKFRDDNNNFNVFEEIYIDFKINVNQDIQGCTPMIIVYDSYQEIFKTFASDVDTQILKNWSTGEYNYSIKLPPIFKKGNYFINVEIGELMAYPVEFIGNALTFTVNENFQAEFKSYSSIRTGMVAYDVKWEEGYIIKSK